MVGQGVDSRVGLFTVSTHTTIVLEGLEGVFDFQKKKKNDDIVFIVTICLAG